MSIGWNPFYNNEKKTAEPWLLHEFDKDFYGMLHLPATVSIHVSHIPTMQQPLSMR
jgi:FAD synthase